MSPARPRNLLVILCDQLRRDALGCYGDRHVSTPHLDAMAGEGVRFTRANSTYPICVPFRFSLMTGQYAHTRMVPGIEWRMSPAERTMADDLNDAGYETIYVGKWHLNGEYLHMPGHGGRRCGVEPVPRDYQGRWKHWRGFELRNGPHDTFYFADDDPTPRPLEAYQTDGLFDLAMTEIDTQRKANKPFACVLSVEPPHPPFEAPADLEDAWRDRAITLPPNFAPRDPAHRDELIHHRRMYYAMVENLDQNVGRMRAFLRENGLDQDTAVVFLSDHGELGGSHGLIDKQYPYEESVGIPLILHDPAMAGPPGRTIDTPTNTEDLMPTCLGLLGLQPSQHVPGADLTPLVREPAATLDRPGVLLEFVSELRPDMPFHNETWRALRTDRHKYIVMGDLTGASPWALYDLAEDPHELHNLLDDPAHNDTAAELHATLRSLLIEAEDRYPLIPAYGCEALCVY